jgi:hypothetical protein
MTARIPMPVRATHDLRRSPSLVIKTGTPGEITGMSGMNPVFYTVTFWPSGLDGAKVTMSNLRRTDLREA